MIQVKELYEIQKDIKDLKENGTGGDASPFEKDWGTFNLDIKHEDINIETSYQGFSDQVGTVHRINEDRFLVVGGKKYNQFGGVSHFVNIKSKQFEEIPQISESGAFSATYCEGKFYKIINGIEIHIYNETSKIWQLVTNINPSWRPSGATPVCIGIKNAIYIIFSQTSSLNNSNIVKWIPSVNRMTLLPPSAILRDMFTPDYLSTDGKYIGLVGKSSGNQNVAGYFNTETETWEIIVTPEIENITNIRAASCNMLPNGRMDIIYIGGGNWDKIFLAQYDIKSATFTSIVDISNAGVDKLCINSLLVSNETEALIMLKGNKEICILKKPSNSIIPVSLAKSDTFSLKEYSGIRGQVIVDTDDNSLVVMDGSTKGGHKVGGSTVDLTPYSTTEEMNTAINTATLEKVDKVEGKSLVPDTDITQITTNKNDIQTNTEDIAKLSSIVNGIQPFTTDWGAIPSEGLTVTRKAPMITGRSYTTSVVVNDDIYVIGGNYSTKNEMYSISRNNWTSKMELPLNKYGGGLVHNKGKLYSVGGCSNAGNAISLDIYDIASNTWSTGAPIKKEKWYCSACSYQDKIYLTGGSNNINTLDIYDITSNVWSTGSPIPADGGGSGPTLESNGLIYLVTGHTSNILIKIYDPETNLWSTGARLPLSQQRSGYSAAEMDGKIYVFGGRNNNNGVRNRMLSIYDIANNEWEEILVDIEPRVSFNLCAKDGVLYLFGGIHDKNDSLDIVETLSIPVDSSINVSNKKATTESLSKYAGIQGQLIVNTDDNSLYVMDGTTKGGHKLATNARVEEVFQSVSNGKKIIETAITGKGGTVSKENQVATFGELSNGIHSIQGEDLVGKQLMLDVIIGKLPALDGVLTIDSPLSEYANYMFGIGPMNIIAKDTVTNGRYSMSKRQVHYTPTNITEVVTAKLVAPITKPFSEVADMKSSKMKTRKCKVVSLGLSDDAIIEFIEEKKWRVDYDERKSNYRNI